jgi:hypothetical protein
LPEAYGLVLVSLSLAAAYRGRRWWLVSGFACGLASWFDVGGMGLACFLILAGGPKEWRCRWPWLGLAVALPWWLLLFGLRGVAFLPTIWLPSFAVANVMHHALCVTPVLLLAMLCWVGWAAKPTVMSWYEGADEHRATRLAWFVAVPFLMLALWPDLTGPAPAYVAIGFGLSFLGGRLVRFAEVGLWTAFIATLLAVVHTFVPLIQLPSDPSTRLEEGPVLGALVAAWALPTGVSISDERASLAQPVYTQHYGEAALIHYYTGIKAQKYPGCGPSDHYDLWHQHQLPDEILLVRPASLEPRLCADDKFPSRRGPHRIDGVDSFGRPVGQWQVFELSR